MLVLQAFLFGLYGSIVANDATDPALAVLHRGFLRSGVQGLIDGLSAIKSSRTAIITQP